MLASYKMSRDKNGNKTVIVTPRGSRGFSIQTLGNLPKTHRNGDPDRLEINEWVSIYGTMRQKALMEVG